MNVQKRVSQGLKVLQYYTTKEWIFNNKNFLKLYEDMNDFDKETFYCDNTKVMDTLMILFNNLIDLLPAYRLMLKSTFVNISLEQEHIY